MPRTRTLTGFTTLTLALACSSQGLAQSEQDNVFDAAGGSAGTYDFGNDSDWSKGGPPWTDDEVDGGISFDLEDVPAGTTDTYTINLAGNYSAIDRLNILSESLIILSGTGSFTFDEDGDLETGDSALRIESGVTLNLEGDMTFDYGNGSTEEEDAAQTLNFTIGGQQIAFNLIIEGLISDNAESAVDGMLTFTGGGFALLTGGIEANGTGSEFGLTLQNGSSLMLASGNYTLAEGVNVTFNGDLEDRENGQGILQIVDGATLDTQDGGDIAVDGFGAILVGHVNLLDSALADLGFGETNEQVATNAATGTGTVTTDNLTLAGDSVVVVGDGSSITATTLDNGILQIGGTSAMVLQTGASGNFNVLELNSGSLFNAGTLDFIDNSTMAGGTFTSSGNTTFANAFDSTGTIDITGGTFAVNGDTVFGSGSQITVSGTGAGLDLATTAASDNSIQIDGILNVSDNAIATFGFDGDTDSINFSSSSRTIVDDASLTVNGELTVSGELFVQNGGSFNFNTATSELLNVDNAFIGGGNDYVSGAPSGQIATIDFGDYTNVDEELIIGTLYSGMIDSETGEFIAGDGILQFNTLVDLDLTDGGTMLFALGWDFDEDTETGTAYNTQVLIGTAGDGLGVIVNEGTTLELAITGDEYIPTGTVWDLFDAGDIEGIWSNVEIEGFNTVTRTFEHGTDGQVIVGTDYNAPAEGGSSVVVERSSWLQERSENGQLTDLLAQFDQVGTVSGYQAAVTAMGPESVASGLQIVADTATFKAYSEALGEMRSANELGRPGPARRPLGQSSQSLFAAQDEADTVRSQYGYGSGPESGQRRTDDDSTVAFVQGYGRSLDLQNSGDVVGLSATQWGVLTGMGTQVSGNSVLGLLVGYDSFNGDLNDNFGSVDVGTIRIGPFYGWSDGTWNVDLALTGAYNDWSGTRENPGIGGMYDWSTNGWELDFSASVGYRIPLGGGFNIVPEGSFVYSYIQTEAYTENAIAGPGALDVSTEDLNGFIGRLGARAELLSFSGLIIEGSLGWQGNYSVGGDIEAGIGGFALPGTPDQVNRNNIYYGTQFTWMPTWDMALTFRYEGRTGDGTDDQYFGGGVSFEF